MDSIFAWGGLQDYRIAKGVVLFEQALVGSRENVSGVKVDPFMTHPVPSQYQIFDLAGLTVYIDLPFAYVSVHVYIRCDLNFFSLRTQRH